MTTQRAPGTAPCHGLALLLLAGMALGQGCTTTPPARSGTGGSGTTQQQVEQLLASGTPAAFVQAQHGVDLTRLLEQVDDWSAVRLGALGPVPTEAAALLHRKRASFLVHATREYGPALAEVFALFVLHSAFDDDLAQVLRLLAEDRQLERTLGKMPVVREQLRRRGMPLSDYPERPERLGDVGRGLGEGLGEAVSATPFLQWGVSGSYDARNRQLPMPYQQALDGVERGLLAQAHAPGSVALGTLDELTFGVPLGLYALTAGTFQGVSSLSSGQYEQAARELAPALLMIAVYAAGKALARTAPPLEGPHGAAPWIQGRLGELKEVARRLRAQLGEEGLGEVARYIQAEREAALLVLETGEAGALALYEARGQVPGARAWLSQAKSERPGPTGTRGRGRVAAPVDAAVGVSQEALDAKLTFAESEASGPRLSSKLDALETQWAALRETAPPAARNHPLWDRYVRYGEERLAELRRGQTAEPPLRWEGYQQMRVLVTRGLDFERAMAEALRADAALPRAQRRFLQDFEQPRVETYVGVWKPESGLRFADVLVIEQKPPPGQPPRVETFSFKSRNLVQMEGKALRGQLKADALEALEHYGETLNIRRPSLQELLTTDLQQVQRVHLIYEGGPLKPPRINALETALKEVGSSIPEVKVVIQ